jgi:L-seryl-tRNA(Ser) seleniumtransferase
VREGDIRSASAYRITRHIENNQKNLTLPSMTPLREIPSVDYFLKTRQAAEMIAAYGRPLTLEALRMTLTQIRKQGGDSTLPDARAILAEAQGLLERWLAPRLAPVINATGVILHTNLGRAPLSAAALQAAASVGRGYSNLEFDLENGARGSRQTLAEPLLTHLTGAEAAMVVNNNAAALLLALTALAKHKRVIISRTQLVEIGGGFRIPEVMSQSGAHLVEIGTTNRVHIEDYAQALTEPAAFVMRAHASNFRIVGFTAEPSLGEIVQMAHQAGVPVIDDLGSGSLIETGLFGLAHEPMAQESLAVGADLVCFSGDKLLGGPQAGILVGRADLIAKLKKHPLSRALRADKLCLAALAATLAHYLKDEAEREIPIWQMIRKTPEQNRVRAGHWAAVLGQGEVIAGLSTVGGGSLPGETLPTYLLALTVARPNQFLAWLRQAHPPIIARVESDRVVLDPRTVLPEEEGALLVGLQNALEINPTYAQ